MNTIAKRILAVAISVLIFVSFIVPVAAASSSGFYYEVIQNTTKVRITGYNGLDANVVIPDILDGRTVEEIGNGAFASHSGIRSVNISSNVTRVMKDAFKNCTALEQVSVPASVISVGDSAFANCVSLKNITIRSASTSIGYYAFEGCTALESVSIPSTKISSGAFRNCTSLESIKLLDSVQSVGRYAFDGTAWYNAQPEGLAVLGNIVYSYTGNESEVVIPDGIKCIAEYAFYATDVTSVVLPEGLYYIDSFAFANCNNMKYISVPGSVISIGTKAFGYNNSDTVNDFTVYSGSDSAAKIWAEQNSLTFISVDSCEHEFSDWTVTEKPDCYDEGLKSHRCVKCNYRETEKVPAKGHSWSGWITISELSCEADGIKRRTCTSCGETENDITITKGHTWGEWTFTTEPDCVNEGHGSHTCTVCGFESVEKTDPLGHTWIVNENTDNNGWVITEETSCSKAGSKYRICTVCEETVTQEIPQKDHITKEWTVVKDPTPVTPGIKQGVCTVCGQKFSQEIPVISENLPENVNELILNSNATIYFDNSGTYIHGVSAETKISDVLLQFKYPGHILVTDTKLEQLDNNSYIGTGCILALLKHNAQTGQNVPVDPACVIVRGDVNGDGVISAADARLALQSSSQLTTLQYPFFVAADTDSDGDVTASDARKILRVASEMDTF